MTLALLEIEYRASHLLVKLCTPELQPQLIKEKNKIESCVCVYMSMYVCGFMCPYWYKYMLADHLSC